MGLFNRKPKDAEEMRPPQEGEAEAFLAHLVQVSVQAALDGTEEAAEHLSEHLAADLTGHHPEMIQQALGLAVIMEGETVARQIKKQAAEVIAGLRATFEQDQAAAAAERGQERPTDLLPDDEPTTAPEAVSEPREAAEKVWPEDRR